MKPRRMAFAAGLAAVAVAIGIAAVLWQQAREREQERQISLCTRAETEFAAAKRGTPVPGAESEDVLRIVVWGCRGRPSHPLPAEL